MSLLRPSLARCRLLSFGLWEEAVPRGLYLAPLRPGAERSGGVSWRLVPAGGLPEVGLDVHLACPQCGVWTPLVLLSAVVHVCVFVGIAVRYKVLCGPGHGAAGQTHVPLSEKCKINRGRRLIQGSFFFFDFFFTLCIHWVLAGLWCLSDRQNFNQFWFILNTWEILNNLTNGLGCGCEWVADLTEDVRSAEAYGGCIRAGKLLGKGGQVITVPDTLVRLQTLFVSVLHRPQWSMWGAAGRQKAEGIISNLSTHTGD